MMKHTFQINRILLLLFRLLLSAGVVFTLTRCDEYQVSDREVTAPIEGMTLTAPTKILEKDKTGLADDATGLKGLLAPRYLGVGKYVELVVVPTPADAAFGQGKKITWAVADTSVAQVQSNPSGLVAGITGKRVGSTTVTITDVENQTQTETFPVDVIYKVDKIALKGAPPPDENPPTDTLEAMLTPASATIKGITWHSSDEAVATVLNATQVNGVVVATTSKAGTAITINDTLKVYGIVTAVAPGSEKVKITLSSDQKDPVQSVVKEYTVAQGTGGGAVILFGYCDAIGKDGGAYDAVKVETTGGTKNIDFAAIKNGDVYVKGDDNYLLVEDTLEIGREKTFKLTISSIHSRSLVWIDWNGDVEFSGSGEVPAVSGEAGEYIPVFGPEETWIQDAISDFSYDITVPKEAILGVVRMRIVTGDTWTYNNNDTPPKKAVSPCGDIKFATIKDFLIKITE